MYKKISTFTLIEMLIVIVIIGILAAALIPRLQSIQGRARDARRKTDFKIIYDAMEIYKLDNGIYAHSGVDTWSFSSPPAWLSGLLGILTSVPVDPINNNLGNAVTGGYSYRFWNLFGGVNLSYHLGAQLENMQDATRCELKNYVYAHTANPIAGLAVCSGPAARYWYVYDPINIGLGKHN